MKLHFFVLGAALASSLAVSAQEVSTPKVEVGLNYSLTRVNPGGNLSSYTANGGSGYVEYNVNRVLGVVADLGGNWVGRVNGTALDNTTFTYLFGPRFNWRMSRVTPYVQALVGGARFSNAYDATAAAPLLGIHENVFATALGGGLDVRWNNHVSFKPVQVEYFMTQLSNPSGNINLAQNNLRYSAGVVFTFGSK